MKIHAPDPIAPFPTEQLTKAPRSAKAELNLSLSLRRKGNWGGGGVRFCCSFYLSIHPSCSFVNSLELQEMKTGLFVPQPVSSQLRSCFTRL